MSSHPVDLHAGARLRRRRLARGMTLAQLGKAAGLTYQQIQKYERGESRMGSSRLFQLCKILAVPIAYFFDGLPAAGPARGTRVGRRREAPTGDAPSPFARVKDPLANPETRALLQAYAKIRDGRVRRLVYQLVRAVGAASQAAAAAARKRRR